MEKRLILIWIICLIFNIDNDYNSSHPTPQLLTPYHLHNFSNIHQKNITMEFWLHDIVVENHPREESGSDFPDRTTIQLFCADTSGKPVYVEVKDFRPWMYVKLNNEEHTMEEIKKNIKSQFWHKNVKKSKIVERKNLMGFTDNTLFKFLKLEFTGMVPMFCGRKKMKEQFGNGISIYESSIDPVLKFFHQTKIRPSAFFKIDGSHTGIEPSSRKSHCELEYHINIKDLVPISEDRVPPPMLMCAYDIEASGLNPANDFVFQVSLCFSRIGEDVNASTDHASSACTDGVVICVGKTESVDGTNIIVVENETELLVKFKDMIIERGVQILMGYNNIQYDSSFLFKRAEMYGLKEFREIGFMKGVRVELTEKVLESSAMGRNELAYMTIPGRVEYDGLQLLRKNYNLSSYKLDSVSEHFFGGSKDNITYADILEACHGKDPTKLGVIAKYCLQDSWLVLRLIDKIAEVSNTFQMANLCTVPLKFILERGQQIKCFSLILDRVIGEHVCNYGEYELKVPGFVKDVEEVDEGFQGATVIEACKGFYPDESIITMDFASLYPSIMRWKELGYTTYINDDKYRGIEGVIYEDYELAPGRFETFAHRPGEKSILSMIEADLLTQRKITKKQMKSEPDPFKNGLLNSKQLAQKITCNSLYGFTGTSKGMLPLKAIAAAVTCTGRKMIEDTSAFVVKLGGRVIYGDTDSVMCIFPVPQEIKDKGEHETRKYLFNEGTIAADKITKIFGEQVQLEFECIYERYLLVSKKRYAAMCWESVDGPPTMVTKGLVTVRRDNAPVVKNCATELLDMLMKKRTNEDIVNYVVETLDNIEKGNIDIEDLTIRKELKKWDYKNPGPHSSLAAKIIKRVANQRLYRDHLKDSIKSIQAYDTKVLREAYLVMEYTREEMMKVSGDSTLSMTDFMANIRSGAYKEMFGDHQYIDMCMQIQDTQEAYMVEGGISDKKTLEKFMLDNTRLELVEWDAPRLGNRIPFVITRGKGKVHEKAEDPEFVKKARISVDLDYYITKQLQKPLTQLMELFLEKGYDINGIFSPYIRRARNSNEGRMEITSFFGSAGSTGKRKR